MRLKQHALIRVFLLLFVLIAGLHLSSGKAEAAINWEANCSGAKTLYGYDPGNITNINFGSVVQGTASVSRTSSAGVHVCSGASYSSVANAAIQATSNSRLTISPERREYGTVNRGATEYQSVTVTANVGTLGVGTYELCFNFSGAATYNGVRHTDSGSACGTITITAPVQQDGTIAVKKMIPDGNGWKVGSPAVNNPTTYIGYASSGANEWSRSYAPGVYGTKTDSPPSGWRFVKTTATYSSTCGSHSGTETSDSTLYDVRICSNQTVTVRFHYAPDTGPQIVSCTLFTASPQSFSNPGNTTLSWQTTGGTAWSINNGVGSVSPGTGSRQIYVASTNTYTLTVTGAGGSDTCSTTVTVTPTLAPAYGPWLQSKRGNVLALGYIESQVVGALGSRPATDTSKDAEHVIMGYLANTPQASNFCSKNNYNFGTGLPATCSYASANVGYRANVASQASIGTANDPAVVSLDRAIAARAGLAANQCTAKAPYLVTALASTTLPNLLGANDTCPVVITSNSITLSASTISSGRGTLYVNGNLTINGNITYDYVNSPYPSVNLIPNLGIIATGDIIISPGVTRVDASLYSLKQVKTCSAYPSPSCNQKLTVRGKLAAAKGFELGRNYRTGTGNPTSQEPAELIIGSGLIEAFPPPGFVDLTASSLRTQKLTTEANPRF